MVLIKPRNNYDNYHEKVIHSTYFNIKCAPCTFLIYKN